ncbi:hypothetical protein N7474_003851 [Penicillium riverlandense]|uniref:uncharacterized protein n=1 Tax=Penicillium riverlandense TaxID=1903569 RepID=UPI0025465A89|nr:uncharacterized protein N7474_003851 [Penicillium riverlandense]KAJ5818260.1 hypothetical protein N7474_003851 [Penicillium riverlandense]
MRKRTGRRPARNPIRGPYVSTFSDLAASNNISAAQIRDDYEQRLQTAQQQAEQEAAQQEEAEDTVEDSEYQPDSPEEQTKKRKRQQAIERTKKSKEFARRKARRAGEPDDDDDDALANEMVNEKERPKNPGQLANCKICEKRFTVTPYSKTGPRGGLLCADCSKKHAGPGKKAPAKKRSSGIGRRQNQKSLLDGYVSNGAPSLLETCIKKVGDNIDNIEEFGDLPPQLMHRLSQILSRNRAVNSRTLELFLRPQYRSIDLYDCAKLDTDAFHKILASMPGLTRLNLRFVTPFKDAVFEYMLDRDLKIQDLQLDSPNLVSNGCWRQLFMKLGPQLQTLKLWNLDWAFDDETAEIMCNNCTGLRRLKLKHLWNLGDAALKSISSLKSLEHLSLNLKQETTNEPLLHMVSQLGPNLRTLSLEEFQQADDQLLQSIHDHCHHLSKLRLTSNAIITDRGLADLFRDWKNPALTSVDFHALRDVDTGNPAGPPEPIGLASDGFKALMEHSGSKLETLNIASCRHITHAAFEEVFSEKKRYPALKSLDISFQVAVDDYVAQCIVRCCPALTKLVVFGCFGIRDLRIHRGVAPIGLVTAKVTVD